MLRAGLPTSSIRSRKLNPERVRLLVELHDDPDGFNTYWLGRSPYWWRQAEICKSIVNYRQTLVYSGNAIGKDYLVGGIVPWWLKTRPDALAIVTGPSQTTLGSITWKEIRRAIEKSRIPIHCRISSGVKTSPQTVVLDGGWQALGYSTTSVERASGQHAQHLLVIVEEASGVDEEIWHAVDALKFTRLLAIGNPLRPDGEFVRRIRQADADRRDGIPPERSCNAICIPSTESPHAEMDESPWGLADRTWLNDCIRRYGKDSLWVRSHIRAEIPEVAAELLIPDSWLDYAAATVRQHLPVNHPVHQTRRLSVDLGEGVGRDSSAVLVRDDLGIIEVIVGDAIGLPEAAALMHKLGQKWSIPAARMSYDRLGIGKQMPNQLARYGLQAAIGYAGEASPAEKHAFTNLRSEAAWKLRCRLDVQHVPDLRAPHSTQPPFHIPTAGWYPRLREELRPLTYSLVGKATKLLPKADWTEILGHSPDVADALIQSFAF